MREMNQNSGKLALGLLALLGVWILVYWLAPASPKVTFAEQVTIEPPPEETVVPPVVQVPQSKPKPQSEPAKNEPVRQPERVRPHVPDGGGVIAPEFIDHTVAAGETFDTIAAKYYGKRGMGNVIARANPFADPRRLKPGRVLKVPKDPGNIQGIEVVPESAEERIVVVRAGDTLSSISKAAFGTVNMADAIFDANRDTLSSPDDLAVGQRLRLPKGPT